MLYTMTLTMGRALFACTGGLVHFLCQDALPPMAWNIRLPDCVEYYACRGSV